MTHEEGSTPDPVATTGLLSSRLEHLSRRLERLPINGFGFPAILTAAFCFFVEAMDLAIVADVLTPVQKQLDLSATQVGLLSVAANLTTVLTLLIAGRLADMIGRRRVLLIGLTTASGFTLLTYFANGYASLVAFRLLSGIGLGLMLVLPMTYMLEFVSNKWRGIGAGICNTAFGFSYVVTLLIANALVPRFGYPVLFLVAGLLVLGVPLVAKFSPESPRWLVLHGRESEADRMVSKVEDRVVRKTGRDLPPVKPVELVQTTTTTSGGESWRSALRTILVTPKLLRLLLLVLAILAVMLVVNQTRVLYMPYILQSRGISYSDATLQAAIMNVMAIPGNFGSGLMAGTVGRRVTIATFGAGTLVTLLIFSLVSAPLWVVIAGGAIFFFDVLAVPKAFASESLPTTFRAFGSGMLEFGSRIIGQVIWVPLVPLIIAAIGVSALFGGLAVLALLGVVVPALLVNETRGKAIL